MNAIKNLFKEVGIKDVITLFHDTSNPASIRVNTLLKQVAANAQTTATEDQASEHPTQSKTQQANYSIDVQEEPPTPDQLSSILSYLGPTKAGSVVTDATGGTDALRKFKKSPQSFQRPVVVDWTHGKAVVGDNESEILKLLRERSSKS